MTLLEALPVVAQSNVSGISLLDLLSKGGIIIIPILLLSLISVYIFVDKYISIYKSSKVEKGFAHRIALELKQNRTAEATRICRNNNAMGAIFENGILMHNKSISEMEAMMETTANVEIAKMERNVAYLGIIASVAPILGFIGTISGVIAIFYNISLTDNVSIGGIADGLYQKMISSGTGLFVGVIAYSCYHVLQMRIDKFSQKLQEEELSLLKSLQE
jgi:biopolymer transport protein ExbB